MSTLRYVSLQMIGAGFEERSLKAALAGGADFIGADAGSCDVGPFQLGGVGTLFSEQACYRDIALGLRAARQAGIPFLIGSCGGSGRDWGVDWFEGMVDRAAREHGLGAVRVAKIYSELEQETVAGWCREGRVHPLPGAPAFDEHVARRSTRIVGVMGPDPFQRAVQTGADVVLAGRASDTAIFSAIPLMRSIPPAVAWHAAKAAESGAAATVPPSADCVALSVDDDGFVIEPANEAARCTPFSVAAIQLYENADPYRFTESRGVIDSTAAVYTPLDDRGVRVTGATFSPRDPPTVKLEGVELVGYQSIVMASLRDPVLLEDLDHWLAVMEAKRVARVDRAFGREMSGEYAYHLRVYGRDGTLGTWESAPGADPREVFLLMDFTAATQELASSVASASWHAAIHASTRGWTGVITAAWPYNPHVIDRGPVYRFNVHHVVDMPDPCEPFRFAETTVGA